MGRRGKKEVERERERASDSERRLQRKQCLRESQMPASILYDNLRFGDPIAVSNYDKFSVGPVIQPICASRCFTMS